MKRTADIQKLLDRYWEGETSLDEERALKQYFQGDNIDPRLQEFTPLFQAISAEKAVEYPKAAAIRPVPVQRYRWAAAAAILLLLSAGAIWWHSSRNVQVQPEMVKVNEMPAAKPAAAVPDMPEIVQVSTLKKGKHKFRRPRAITVEAPVTDESAEAARKEILEAFTLLSTKLKKGRKEMDKGLREVEHIDIIKRKPTEG